MKYRAITVGVIQFEKGAKPLQTFSDSMDIINGWAHEVSRQYKVDVKVYETYERVLATIRKPYEKGEEVEKTCVCGVRVFCPSHPEKGFQKGRQ